MKYLILTSISALLFLFSVAPSINAATIEEKTVILKKTKDDSEITKFPQKPAYSPVYCVVTGNEIDVYCQYEATGDILVVDSRTGLTVASETAVELGEGYTLYIPDQYAEAPLTIYVTIAGTTYWGEI